MTRPVLTRAEQDVFDILQPALQAGRRPPTYQAIAAQLGLSSKGRVCTIVGQLTDKGYVTHRRGVTSSMALAPTPDSVTISLPPELAARLEAYLGPWSATPDDVIAKALTEYLGRHA